jgi:hypothetical protein
MIKKFSIYNRILITILLFGSLVHTENVTAQNDGRPPAGESCVVSVGNRNAPLAADGSYFVAAIPDSLGIFRARVTCSDGSVGQSGIGFSDLNQVITVELGDIEFGRLDPVPIAVNLSAAERRLNSGESSQLSLQAVAVDGSIRDVTNRSEGTVYSISNDLLANFTEDGLITVTAQFDTSSYSRLVASATTEGSVSSTYMFILGPTGSLIGTVNQADGTTPVLGAQVSVLRLQPMEVAGFAVTDENGQFELPDVNAGAFIISVIDPSTGDRAIVGASIENESQLVEVFINLNGLGVINVTVLDENDIPINNSEVSLALLGIINESRTMLTNEQGLAVFSGVPAGDFSVSTRDPASGLLDTALARLHVNETLDIGLKLQKTGAIQGRVFQEDGITSASKVQVRVLSQQRGLISQTNIGVNGGFDFDTLPIGDGPFTLDAFVNGRLRARVPNLTFATDQSLIEQNIVLDSVGKITGIVQDMTGFTFANAKVTMQSMNGSNLSFDAFTNEEGKFVLPAVPLGDFELTALTENGQLGTAAGRIETDGESIELNIIISGDSIIGTVFERDGVTPVGAGVSVYLAARSAGFFQSYINSNVAILTTTDADGNYGFSVTLPGDYIVQAESGLERGRSRSILVNLDFSQPLETDITFLAKGRVTGIVRDADGNRLEDVAVQITSQGLFSSVVLARTNSFGVYSANGVFAGNLLIRAVNETTGQSALKQSSLEAEGELVRVNMTLSASATIHGQILTETGRVVDEPVRINVLSNNNIYASLVVENGNNYQVDFVPLGNVTVFAEVISSGNLGKSTSSIDFHNDEKNIDVRMVGQGTITVALVDENGIRVSNAAVTVRTGLPFSSSQQLVSDGSGVVQFENIFAGDFSLIANKELVFGSLTGSTFGTLLPNESKFVILEMEAIAVGRVNGVVYESDGVTPVGSGWVVRMLPEPFANAFVTSTNENGEYSYNQVNAGTYSIDVLGFFGENSCPSQDRIRGRTTGVSIGFQGQETTANIQLIGQGEVFGLVVNDQGEPVADINISLNNPDPALGSNVQCSGGRTFNTVTDENGRYRLTDIPPGNFTMLAENQERTQRAEGSGRVRFDTDIEELNLTLVNNVVTMPQDFYDANGFLFDINGDGSIGSGTNNIFAAAAPDNAAMRLEIVNNGIALPFLNGDGSIGRISTNGLEIEVDDVMPSGLFITRRIFTPRSGYFSRYLEVLENPTDQEITVDVRIKSHHRASSSNSRVVNTSDGDQILSVANQAAPDRWVIVDDERDIDPFRSGSIPATGYVFDGNTGATQVASAQYELIGQTGRLSYQWNQISIPAGETKILMHFVYGQIKRTGARDAALRLIDLPPEAIDDLNTEDRAAIINFGVPEFSNIEPLPNLDAGDLSGSVFSANGVSKIPGVDVTFVSQHPLFKRVRFTTTDELGSYSFVSTLDGTEDNFVIPVFAYSIFAEYAITGVSTPIINTDFPIDLTQDIQDIVMIGSGNIRGNVKRHNGALVADTKIELCRQDDRIRCSNNSTPDPSNRTISLADGSYVLYANISRSYFLFADKRHPQNDGRGILGRAEVFSMVTDTVLADIIMEQTGSVSGIVRANDGTPVSNVNVKLLTDDDNNGSFRPARRTTTDTAGFYRFFDAPLGQHQIVATNPSNSTRGETLATVFVDQDTNADITLNNSTTLNVTVFFARGQLAIGSRVRLRDNNSSFSTIGFTDTAGLASFTLAEGEYTLTARHPDNFSLSSTQLITVTAFDSILERAIVLPAAGVVFGTITRPDATTLAGGFPYEIRQLENNRLVNNSSTNNVGVYRTSGLPLGGYRITAFDAEQNRFADAIFGIGTDGQESLVNLTLLENRIALPADLFDANRFKFDIQQNGGLNRGSNAFFDNSVILEIDGQQFTGDTSANLQAGRRQFVIAQDNKLSGLNISRKIYVPLGAYFARYIEVLDNPTASEITVDVNILHHYSAGNVINTSSGDTILNTTDNWFMVDDAQDEDIKLYDNQTPALMHLYADSTGLNAPSSIDFSLNNSRPVINQQWSQITVPAGATVSLMHVVVQQINRNGAQFAAQRLEQLPPEILADLTASDIASIINFNLPVDGVSALESLPSLLGSINGAVLEANESVAVPRTHVTVQSVHPLFSRIWGRQSDSNGSCNFPGTTTTGLLSSTDTALYSIQGQLTATDSIAIPAGVGVRVVAQESASCYGQFSGHKLTNVPSRIATLEASGEQNVIFDTSVVTGTINGSPEFSVKSGRVYLSVHDPDRFPPIRFVSVNPDGSYTYPGLLPGNIDLLVDRIRHPDGGFFGDNLRASRKNISIAANAVFVSDIQLQDTGNLQGSILSFDGTASENAEITLIGEENGQVYDHCLFGCVANALSKHKTKKAVRRKVQTDSLGRYNFNTIPEGVYRMQAVALAAGANGGVDALVTIENIVITKNQTVIQNVVLPGIGAVTINVKTVQGIPVADREVFLEAATIPNRLSLGTSDFAGKLVVDIPVGPYTLSAKNDVTNQEVRVDGTVNTDGEFSSIDVIIPAKANLLLRIVNLDQGNAPLQNAKITVRGLNGFGGFFNGITNNNGEIEFTNLLETAYLVNVEIADDYESSFIFAITADLDGQTITKQVGFSENQHIIDGFNFAQSHRLYQVNANVGDELSLSIRGFTSANGTACQVRLKVYDQNRLLLANARGTSIDQDENIDLIAIAEDGIYTIMLTPNFSNCFSGSYRLSASIDGNSIPVEPLQDVGQVSGTLFEADGTTGIANKLVWLRTTEGDPMYFEQIMTDINGNYQFENVPVGNFELVYVPRQSVTETGTINNMGQQVVVDLILSQATLINVHVFNADGTPINFNAQLKIIEPGKPFFRPFTDNTGNFSYTYFGFETLAISTVDFYDPTLSANQFVEPADGQTKEVNLILDKSTVNGQVIAADGITQVADTEVSAYFAQNDTSITTVTANQQGTYTFDALPIDNQIILKAKDPINSVITTSQPVLTSTQTVTQDIQLAGTGTVFGKLMGIGNAPRANARIDARYLDNSGSTYPIQLSDFTNELGEYRIEHLPIGQTIIIRYTQYTNLGEIIIEGQANLINHNDTVEVNLFIPGAGITLQLLAADNLPINGMCNVFLTLNNGGGIGGENRGDGGFGGSQNISNVSCDAVFGFVGITQDVPGTDIPVNLRVEKNESSEILFNADYQLIENELLEIAQRVSVIKGTVTFFDNSLAPFADIRTAQNFTIGDDLGNYRLIAVPQGQFSITAEDAATSLQSTLNSEITDINIPVLLDIQLPASATISGNVLDVNAQPLANKEVFAASSNSPVVLQTTSDNSGHYEISNITVGDVEVSAVDRTTMNIVSVETVLSDNNEIQTHDLQFNQPGSVSGTIIDINSASFANACVQMKYTKAGLVHQSVAFSTISDSNGMFSFDSAASGQVMVSAKDDCNSSNIAGMELAEIINGTNTASDVQLGNAGALPQILNQNGDNFSYQISSSGEIQPANNFPLAYEDNRPFIDRLRLTVDGVELNNQQVAFSEDTEQQLLLGPTTTSKYSFSRNLYAPVSGKYIRIIDSVTNTSNTAIDVQIKLQGSYGNPNEFNNSANDVILNNNPADNGNRFAIHSFLNASDNSPAVVGYVFAGNNLLVPVETNFRTAQALFSWSWTTTIQPGATHSYLSYVLVNEPLDVNTVTTLTNEIISGTEIDMFNAISPQQQANIINFEAP